MIKDPNPRCSIVEISALDTTRDSAFGATGKLHVAETGAGRILVLAPLLVRIYKVDSGRRLTVLPLYPRLCPPVLIQAAQRACAGCRYSARTPTVHILMRW